MNSNGLTQETHPDKPWILFESKKKQDMGELPPDSFSSKISSSNFMELESTGTPSSQDYEQATSLISDLSSKKVTKAESFYSKDSLKFCRRLAPSFLKLLQTKRSLFVDSFLESTVEILKKQGQILEASIANEEELKVFIRDRIDAVWRGFARDLCCSQNKKISKITKKSWDAVFTYDGFWEALMEEEMELSNKFISKETSALQVMGRLLKKMIFFVNRGMVITFLFLFKAQDYEFREGIKTFDNYLVLSLVPEVFDYYNHKRGVFVDRCCRACKVCKSKGVNEMVLLTIQKAQQNVANFNALLFNMQISPKIELPFNPLSILHFFSVQDIEFLRETM